MLPTDAIFGHRLLKTGEAPSDVHRGSAILSLSAHWRRFSKKVTICNPSALVNLFMGSAWSETLGPKSESSYSNPILPAIMTACVLFFAPSFRRRCAMCTSTVLAEIPITFAISRFVRPRPICCITSASRLVGP